MKAICTSCETTIPASQINVAADVAVCANCDEVFALSSLVSIHNVPDEFDINAPPPGAWFYDSMHGWRIGASTRSSIAFFLVPFMLVWSGFSLGGIYGSQLAKGEFDLGQSLFGIPFVLGTLLFGSIAMMSAFGRVDISVNRSSGKLFTGIGPFGWTRTFNWAEVSSVNEDISGSKYSNPNGQAISFVGKTKLKFASMMSEPRRYFLLQGLRVIHARTKHDGK